MKDLSVHPMIAHLMSPQPSANDVMARHMGFRDAQTAAAYYQRQQEMNSGPAPRTDANPGASSVMQNPSGLLDQILAIHPKVLLGHVLDAWNATGK